MARLLKTVTTKQQQTTVVNYAHKLLSLYSSKSEAAPRVSVDSKPVQRLVEPLTERELKTLRLLATELSPNEIADEMVVAISTVRSYTKRIYSKLNAHSRIEAIHRAKELGLL